MATRKHNTAYTSIKTWHEIVKEGLPIKEKALVYKYLSEVKAPQTSRQIATALHKERGNITRSLFDLEADNKIKVCYTGKCSVTNRTVKYYQINKETN